ncbi:MAG TPA: hypothetical protein ENN11_02880 [Methanomicrobia archaeon]|nr:hypothetical protein [Methanomicrobia archaeon]
MTQDPAFVTYRVDPEELPDDVTIYGNGHVGGKAKGIIFSMKAYQEATIKGSYASYVHFPRSYIITSEFYDSFIDMNYLSDIVNDKCRRILSVKEMKQKFLEANIPDDLETVLYDILEKENGPLIIRSSSLLEDSLKYSFAGIYESIFIPNSGTLEYRIKSIEDAVKGVYASTFNENAKEYRKKHKIPWQKEKMCIVVQNVVGRKHSDDLYFPLIAGVAFSKNYYPWSKRVKMEDGIGRLVAGLGTRAVGRNYARVFSLSNPKLRPEGSIVNEIVRYSQTKIDVLDLATGEFQTLDLDEVKKSAKNLYITSSTLKENQYFVPTQPHIGTDEKIVPTFERILSTSKYYPFIPVIDEILSSLERLFGIAIDIEFAMDFDDNLNGTFYLVQARPLGSRPEYRKVRIPRLPKEDIIIRSKNVLGNGFRYNIPHIVYVPPENFNAQTSYAIAREIGKVNEILQNERYILVGPGRWGTSTPELGVPVTYSEISNATVIVEVSTCGTDPELSFGTHFFGDLMSLKTLYIPVFMEKGGKLNREFFDEQPNRFNSDLIKLITYPKGFKVYVDGEKNTGIVCMQKKREANNSKEET